MKPAIPVMDTEASPTMPDVYKPTPESRLFDEGISLADSQSEAMDFVERNTRRYNIDVAHLDKEPQRELARTTPSSCRTESDWLAELAGSVAGHAT